MKRVLKWTVYVIVALLWITVMVGATGVWGIVMICVVLFVAQLCGLFKEEDKS